LPRRSGHPHIETEFFGKIDEIFTEISPNKVERLSSKSEVESKLLDENYFSIKLGDVLIEVYEPGVFEVEFSDRQGRTYALDIS
jgi:Domain of unknown function (DUF4926)